MFFIVKKTQAKLLQAILFANCPCSFNHKMFLLVGWKTLVQMKLMKQYNDRTLTIYIFIEMNRPNIC